MKKVFISLVIALAATNVFAQSKADTVVIINVAKDYFEGYYTGDTLRMDRAMHDDLVKRRKTFHKDSQKDLLHHISKSVLVEYTRSGYGKATPLDSIDLNIEIYEIFNDIASVKVSSIHYFDFCHIVKFNNKWQIVHVLWTKNK